MDAVYKKWIVFKYRFIACSSPRSLRYFLPSSLANALVSEKCSVNDQPINTLSKDLLLFLKDNNYNFYSTGVSTASFKSMSALAPFSGVRLYDSSFYEEDKQLS